ncbi:MAG: hypothetical protein AABW68_00940, partial [archaeon]
MADILKDFYFAAEDKWYAALDFLDRHGIPVYKAIDPIDQRIPSFGVFAFLVLIGIASFFTLGGIIQGENVTARFQVVDAESSPLPNIPILFTHGGESFTEVSGPDGVIELLVPSGTKIEYEINLESYEIVEKSVRVTENTIEIIQLSEIQDETLSKTLKLVNAVGQPILGDAELSFQCSTSYGVPPSPISGTGGLFVVTPNADCIPFSVTIHAPGYEDVQSYPLTEGKDVYSIVLTEKTIRDAAIVVTVKDASNQTVSGLEVTLQSSGILVERSTSDAVGTASFSVAAGSYDIVVSDPFNGIYPSVQESIYVGSGDTAVVTITVSKNAASTMVVTVNDTANKPLKDATVRLKEGNTTLSTVVTGTDGKANLPISDKTLSYTVSASKEGYVPQQQNVSGGQGTLTFVLEKATGTNTAKLKVFIVDQDGEPVADAQTVLYNADTGFLSPYPSSYSDVNGIATFHGVGSGNYTPFAYKASLKGFGQEQFFDITDAGTHSFSLKLEIPDGIVSIRVTDLEGEPVPFAKVSVYNAFKNTLLGADLTDTNGVYVLPSNGQRSKADKDVFMVVSKTGYATLTTIQKPILPDTTQWFDAQLNPTKPNGSISIEFTGLFDEQEKIVTGVGKGKTYAARFRVEIPESLDELDEMTVHVRTGDMDIVEKDDWHIQKVNFPRAGVVKGGSWDPANGLNIDGENITNGNGKWINAFHSDPNPGVYELEVLLQVKETAAPQEILKLSYKVMAENGETVRDPVDANPSEELYAATKSSTYQVGVTTTCDDSFCFDASIFDVKETLIEDVGEQYNATVFKDYRLTFNLLNNGSAFHTNSDLRITSSSDGIDFTTYELYNADAQLIKGMVNDSQFEDPIPMGSFTPQKKIGGSIHFTPKEIGTTVLTLTLISDFQPVFSKNIQINVNGDQTMNVTIIPDTYPSHVPITLNLYAEDAATSNEIGNAMVSLQTNLGILLASEYTDAAGNAEIDLSGQAPGKEIELRVEKESYTPFVQILTISDQVITIQPQTLGINLNVKTEKEKTKSFTITNELGQPVVITGLTIQGNLKGLVDKEKTESALLPFTDQVLNSKAQLQVSLKSVLTPEALLLTEHADISAILAIEVESYGNTYLYELPLTYSLGVSSEVDDPTCLVVAPNQWSTSTEGGTVTYEFQVQNNCSIAGLPSALQELKAKAVWSGNEVGEIVLSVFEQNNPTAIGAAKVRSGYFSNVLPALPAEDTLIARLDFTPYGGISGEGSFIVQLQATNPLEGKPQLLVGEIQSMITVVNLTDCITYDKEILDLIPGKTDTLTITTNGCGAPVEFTLQSDLELPSTSFTLQGTDAKTMEIGDNQLDQGQYPIYVDVEGNEDKVPSQSKILRARIRDPNACLQLNRYEFDVYDDPSNDFDGYDTARLDNYCTEQRVKVIVKIDKEFMDSLQRGLRAGLIAGVATWASNLLQGKNWDGSTGETVSESTPPVPSEDVNPDGTYAKGETSYVLDTQGNEQPLQKDTSGNFYLSTIDGKQQKVYVNPDGSHYYNPGGITGLLYGDVKVKPAPPTSETLAGNTISGTDLADGTKVQTAPVTDPSPGADVAEPDTTSYDEAKFSFYETLPGFHELGTNELSQLGINNTFWVSLPNGSLGLGTLQSDGLVKNNNKTYGKIEEIEGKKYFIPVEGLDVQPAESSPVTGFAILFDTPGARPVDATGASSSTAAAGTSAPNPLVNALGGLTNIVSLGTGNPLTAFFATTIVTTLFDYWTSDDQEFEATVTANDLVLD